MCRCEGSGWGETTLNRVRNPAMRAYFELLGCTHSDQPKEVMVEKATKHKAAVQTERTDAMRVKRTRE